jgi:hypothetical protein
MRSPATPFSQWSEGLDLFGYDIGVLIEFSITLMEIWSLPETNPKRSFDWQ